MTYLENWCRSLMASRSLSLRKAVRVEGIRKVHLGPRMDFAVVEFVVEPSDGFLVALDVPGIDADAEHQRFIEWAVFGLLDVAMVAEPYPLKEMKVTVVRAEFDAVSSNQVAFRLAGRDAGRKLMAELQKPNLSRA